LVVASPYAGYASVAPFAGASTVICSADADALGTNAPVIATRATAMAPCFISET